jgi:hypothetical protein
MKNIESRGGNRLPIEERILTSIERMCTDSGLSILDVNKKYKDWGGGLKARLQYLELEDAYASVQRIPSHAVHGTWADLLVNHLKKAGNGKYSPDSTWREVDPRSLLPVCSFVLRAATEYVHHFIGDVPELRPLHERVKDLSVRIHRLDQAHEQWHHAQWQDKQRRNGSRSAAQ